MDRRWFWLGSTLVLIAYFSMDYWFVDLSTIVTFTIILTLFSLIGVGIYDIFQKRYNILRIYPIIGHLRYILLAIRPQIRAYFIESDQDGRPFSREDRFSVYSRAEKANDTVPFGTQRDVNKPGFSSIHHSLRPVVTSETESRIIVGNEQCKKPYSASRINISAMSFGAISKNAVRALNRGAKIGRFAHNTGEGGLSSYHLIEGGDIIWQIGTGYFGCRTKDGNFDANQFKNKSKNKAVKMIEIKLSQGAKPSHGGILPAEKVTKEIAEIRGIPMGKDCVSPPAHTAFSTPKGLLQFVKEVRDLSGGKPTGFKLCIGDKCEFMAIVKAMLETQIYPDFITVDGAEGGTGAAPMEFADFIGLPLNEGLPFVHSVLKGAGLRKHIRIIASGKIISGFDIITKLALGADMCNSARGMMFSLGCVQSRRCHLNTCPTGVATQKPSRMYALDVDNKAPRVANFHDAIIKAMLDILGASGLTKIKDLKPWHVYYRTGVAEVQTYSELYTFMKEGQLLGDDKDIPDEFKTIWKKSSANCFTT